jgi:hypothetical protein
MAAVSCHLLLFPQRRCCTNGIMHFRTVHRCGNSRSLLHRRVLWKWLPSIRCSRTRWLRHQDHLIHLHRYTSNLLLLRLLKSIALLCRASFHGRRVDIYNGSGRSSRSVSPDAIKDQSDPKSELQNPADGKASYSSVVFARVAYAAIVGVGGAVTCAPCAEEAATNAEE